MTDLANFIINLGPNWDNVMVPLRLLTSITTVTTRDVEDTVDQHVLSMNMLDTMTNTYINVESKKLTPGKANNERKRITRLSNLIFTKDEVKDFLTDNTGSKNLPEIEDVVSYPKLAEYVATIQQVPHAVTIIGYDAASDSYQFDTNFNAMFKQKFIDSMDPMDAEALKNDNDRALYLAFLALNELISQFLPVDVPPLDRNIPELGGVRGSNRDSLVTQKINIDNKDT